VVKFDDLPPQYQGNVDTQAPFDRHIGDPPPLSEADIRDILAFLNALTDVSSQQPRLVFTLCPAAYCRR
jgi:cytochrome c peroxidase